jgi:trehalose 6-phosphate synthase/phosphatase
VQYLYRGVSQREVVTLYRAADVMLVTPLRDGMNLVAKEFVASRVDEDGVLVLSEFTGAASELAEAVAVNPYDIDATAQACARALAMSRGERRTRMRGLRHRVLAYDVHRWVRSFLRELEQSGDAARPAPRAASEAELRSLVSRLGAPGLRWHARDPRPDTRARRAGRRAARIARHPRRLPEHGGAHHQRATARHAG